MLLAQIRILKGRQHSQLLRGQLHLVADLSGAEQDPVKEDGALFHEGGEGFFMPMGEQPP